MDPQPASTPCVALAKGATVFSEGDRCKGFPIVLEGWVSVRQRYPSGRIIELYRLGPGDSCLLSLNALTGPSDVYPAHALALTDCRVEMLDLVRFDRRLADDVAFRRQVLGSFASRLSSLAGLVEDMVELRVDQRLASLLVRLGPTIHATHVELACELGTVREMVSRILLRFQRERWLVLGRGRIVICDSGALARFGGNTG